MIELQIVDGWRPSDYELVDFGNGRKLERFAGELYDRPSPSAENQSPRQPHLWQKVHATYDGERGQWCGQEAARDLSRRVIHGSIQFELRRSAGGQLGVFPEQSPNWLWMSDILARAPGPLKLLNLFAYTGGSTLTAAAASSNVVHVDASRTAVQWARQNARASALQDCPIRWIHEDAAKFVSREVKRGNRYDGVILDPPSYGHGPKGEVWSIDNGLPDLMERCGELTDHQPALVLLTCHSPGYDADRLAQLIRQNFDTSLGSRSDGDLWLCTAAGRKIHCGNFARCAGSLGGHTAQ